jgi:tetratricopeptide (TPR) repeat protein
MMIVVAIFLLLFFVVIPYTILSSNATEQINSITTNNANANINDLISQGYISISRGNFSQAITYFDIVLKLQPNNFIALNGKDASLIELGNYSQAISYSDKVLAIAPKAHTIGHIIIVI